MKWALHCVLYNLQHSAAWMMVHDFHCFGFKSKENSLAFQLSRKSMKEKENDSQKTVHHESQVHVNTLTFLFVKMKLVQVFKKKKKSLMKLKALVVKTVYRQQNIILGDIASFGQKVSDRLVLFLWHQGCIFLIILSGSQVPTLFYPKQRLLAFFSFT